MNSDSLKRLRFRGEGRRQRSRRRRFTVESLEVRSLLSGIEVTTALDVIDANDGVVSLREAIASANADPIVDTITFDPNVFAGDSTISLGGTELEITKTLTIDASDVPGSVTIDAGQQSRVLNFSSVTGDLTISGLTLTGGETDLSSSGGGIQFQSNGTLSLTSSTVSGNTSGGGGGIFTSSGSVSLTSSIVSANRSSAFEGGGISTGSGSVSLMSSTISGNTSGTAGGGIDTQFGSVSLMSSTISGNTSGAAGGGIYTEFGSVSLTSSTISGNTSAIAGGGIYSRSGHVSLTSSTISGNTASSAGGGVYAGDSGGNPAFNVSSSIIAGNSDDGAAPDLRPNPGSTPTISHSLIGVADGLSLTVDNLRGSAASPLDPLLGPLAFNGGETRTHALLPGSPAIDAGFSSGQIADQRGLPFVRDLDDPNTFGSGVDIGAYERQTVASFPPLVVTTADDNIDPIASFGSLSLRQAIGLANGSIGPDTITFDPGVFTGGDESLIRLALGELEITDTLTIDASTATDVTITGDADDNDIAPVSNVTDIDASLANDPNSLDDNTRVLHFFGPSGDLTLRGLTITGGQATGTEATGDNDGGGILFASDAGTLTLTDSTVRGNGTTGSEAPGGGIFATGGHVTLTRSTVSDNRTLGLFSRGAGIYTEGGDVTLTGSTLSRNRTTGDIASGGGIFTNSGGVSVTSSTISGNQTTASNARGGGIYTRYGAVSLNNSTITGNEAAAGGGVAVYDSLANPDFTVRNTIIAGNTGIGTTSDLSPDPTSAVAISHSLIGVADGLNLSVDNLTGSAASPLDPLLGPLAYNGGQTQTHALLSVSPAIDAGISTGELFDQRGLPFVRDFDDANTVGSGVDIGAYERQTVPGLPPLVVTTTDDTPGPAASFSSLSLRQAIGLANGSIGPNTITFDPNAFSVPGTIELNSQLPRITDELTITGPGAELLTIDAGGGDDGAIGNGDGFRIFHIDDGANIGQIDIAISGMTLTGGDTDGLGGAISNSENLTITDSAITGNHAESGGGIRNLGTVTINRSTLSGNIANALGGGIYNQGGATLTSSTLSGNSADSIGGGIFNVQSVAVNSSTLSGNTANSAGGGIYSASIFSSVSLNNSIVANSLTAGSSGGDVAGSGALTGSHNLIGDGTGLSGLSDGENGNQIGTMSNPIDPLLSPLVDNGGPTLTHALLPGSPAIDTGSSSELSDQRGFDRNVGGGVDIGAFEAQELPSFIVTTDQDVIDETDQLTSLREAIRLANGNADANAITFDSSFDSAQVIQLSAELTITDDVTIIGPGADLLTIDAGGGGDGELGDGDGFRIFHIDDGDTAAQLQVSISGLTITGGDVAGGGGIRSREDLNLSQVTITRNASSFGGAINHTRGRLVLDSSTLSHNQVSHNGGAIDNGGEAEIVNSTLSSNTAGIVGGAIMNFGHTGSPARLTIRNSTLTGNTASSVPLGSGIANYDGYSFGTATIYNTIITNSLRAAGGTFSGAHNLLATTGDVTDSASQRTESPGLGPLAGNGGPTLTHALLPGSPAFHAGDPDFASPPDLDQRGEGFGRVAFGRIDIGAFEVAEFDLTIPAQGLIVSTTEDKFDLDFSVGDLSLREAILIANDVSGSDTITLDPAVFTGGADSVIRLSETELEITDTVIIDASEATDVVVSGDALGNDTLVAGTFITDVDSILQAAESSGDDETPLDDNIRVINFTGIAGDLTLRGLTITGGLTTGGSDVGGGIRFGDSGFSGALNLQQSSVSGNLASGLNAFGGGVYTHSGEVNLTGSTISGNVVVANDSAFGGGIFSYQGDVNLTNNTVSQNRATGASGGGAEADGGGIFMGFGEVTLNSSTITGNEAARSGGGIFVFDSDTDPSITINNSIVAENLQNVNAPGAGVPNDLTPDPDGTLKISHSLIGHNSGTNLAETQTADGSGNLIGGSADGAINPLLGPLADNGGPTLTHALLAGSPAIDAGSNVLTSGLANDQRGDGFTRILDGDGDSAATVDIGAFELVPADLLGTRFDAFSDWPADGQTDVEFTVQNAGGVAAGAFTTHIVWSKNDIVGDADDVVVPGTNVDFAGLDPQQSENRTVSVQLDRAQLFAHAIQSDAPGQSVGAISNSVSHLFVVIDVNNDVAELNEQNNSGRGKLLDSDDVTYFPWDTDANGTVTPLEAIAIINSVGSNDANHDFDTNGIVTPLEALSTLQRIGLVANHSVRESFARLSGFGSQSPIANSKIETTAALTAPPPVAQAASSSSASIIAFADDQKERNLFAVAETSDNERLATSTRPDDVEVLDHEFANAADWLSIIS